MTAPTISTFSRSTSPIHAAGYKNAVSRTFPEDVRFPGVIAPDAGCVKTPLVRDAFPHAFFPFSAGLPTAGQSVEAQDVRIAKSRPSAFIPPPASSSPARHAVSTAAPDQRVNEESGAWKMHASQPVYRRAGYPLWQATLTGNSAIAYPLVPVTVVHSNSAAKPPAENPDGDVHELYTFITRHAVSVRVTDTVFYMKDGSKLFHRSPGDTSIYTAYNHVNLLRNLVTAVATDTSQSKLYELRDIVVACLQSVIKTVSYYLGNLDMVQAAKVPQYLLAIAKEDPAFRAVLEAALNTMPTQQKKILGITERLRKMSGELPSKFSQTGKRKAEDVNVSDAKRRRTEDISPSPAPGLACGATADSPVASSAVCSDSASFQVDATDGKSLAPTKKFDDLRTVDDVKLLFKRPRGDCSVEKAKTHVDTLRGLVEAILNGESHLQIDTINAIAELAIASVLKTRRHFQALKDVQNANAATDHFIALAKQDPVFSNAMKIPLNVMPSQMINTLSIMARMKALWLEQAGIEANRRMDTSVRGADANVSGNGLRTL